MLDMVFARRYRLVNGNAWLMLVAEVLCENRAPLVASNLYHRQQVVILCLDNQRQKCGDRVHSLI